MAAKRALVVDDSKSARAFLAKLLREQQIEVDSAETAEQAIDYLSRARPDVIFMDHLMPGMDGFQAVQAIKGNPQTATIPILMYTSQEGELYLGQARALGAVGVLPKSVAEADVRMVLQQLQLLEQPEPPTVAEQREVLDAAVAVAAAVEALPPPVPAGPPVEDLLREEVARLRQQLSDALDAQGRRLIDDVRVLLREAMPPPPAVLPASGHEKPRHSPVPWLLALAASAAAAVLGTLLWQSERQTGALRAELADTRANVSLLLARLDPAYIAAAASAWSGAPAVGTTLLAQVPFGEAPFGGARIGQLREYVARVALLGLPGTVEVRRYAGRFCLAGGSGAYTLAAPATPAADCDLIADAGDPQLGLAEPESVEFASALAQLRREYGAQITIDVGVGRDEASDPPRTSTAGEWNAAAASHNRVEMRWLPAS